MTGDNRIIKMRRGRYWERPSIVLLSADTTHQNITDEVMYRDEMTVNLIIRNLSLRPGHTEVVTTPAPATLRMRTGPGFLSLAPIFL